MLKRIVPGLLPTLLIVGACEDPSSPESDGLAITRVSGNAQRGTVGALLADPLTVLVTDFTGKPVAQQRVDFAVLQGAATVLTEVALTDEDGLASTLIHLGDMAGTIVVHVAVFRFGASASVDFSISSLARGTSSTGDTTSPGDASAGTVPVGEGSVLRLDGDGDWVKIPVLSKDNPLCYPGTGGWTVQAWVRLVDRQGVAVVAGQASINVTGFDPYYLELGDATMGCCGGGSFKIASSTNLKGNAGLDTPPIAIGQWIHVAGTYDPLGTTATLNFYVDGMLASAAQTTASIASRASENDPFAIGSLASFFGDSGWVPVHGDIDEVSVWSYALSAAQISNGRHRALTGSEPGLQGYWTFNDLTAEGRVPDITGHGNDGILLFDAHLAQAGSPVP